MKSVQSVHKGIPTVLKGFSLARKKDKTEEELEASRSFTSMVAWTIILAVLGIFAMFLVLHFTLPSYPGIARSAKREGDQITYVYQTYRSADYDPDRMELEDGQSVIVFLDSQGNIISMEDTETYNTEKDKADLIALAVCLIGGILIIAMVAIIPRKAGKDYLEWLKKQKPAKKS